ncbi:MAG: MBL fold metallo-hydrolase [Bacteroidales bacterium]
MKTLQKLLCIMILALVNIELTQGQTSVTLTWYGQSTFLMKTGDGVKVLMDPANPNMIKVDLNEPVDLVTVSHEHGDHNYVALAKGNPVVLRGLSGSDYAKVDETVKGIHVRTVATFHDNQGGAQRGKNAIFIFDLPGMKVVHVGDLGHVLTEAQVKETGKPDILMIPVGEIYTLDLQSVIQVIKQLNPRIIIPMHFSPANAQGGLKLGTVEDFLKVAGSSFDVKYSGHSETFVAGKLPSKTTIIVMKTSD